MSGTGKTIANGGMLITGIAVGLNERTIDNPGTATWETGRFNAGNGAVFNNTGTIDITSDMIDGFFIDRDATLNNTGTLRKSISTGTASLPFFIDNTGGTVEVLSGTLGFLNGGLTHSPLLVSPGAGLEFGIGTFTLEVDMSVPGPVSLTSGTFTGAGDLTVEGPSRWG